MACEHLQPEHLQFDLRNRLIHKDECTLCYSSNKDPEGVNVCLRCFNGGCGEHSQLHFQKTAHALVVNIKSVQKPTSQSNEPVKITKVAIGVEGGAAYSGEEWETQTLLRCLACGIDLQLPDEVVPLVDSILVSNSAMFDTAVGEWEMEQKPCTHTKGLVQTGGPIAEKSLAGCGECDLSSNLWLCMTCGHLGCGRQAYDGSGGNGHGVAHHQTTGHPLVCKMGTITPEGKASIHCYACDEEVVDEELSKHLATFGIIVSKQVKTEKSIAEMELEANLTLTLSKAIEKGKVLVPKYGPGYTGLTNLGNSCYMNSILQTVFSFPRFVGRYYNLDHVKSCRAAEPAQCLFCQLTKLLHGLMSGRYSVERRGKPVETQPGVFTDPEPYQDGIRPQMLKTLVARGNRDFSGSHQQDAFEYFQHFLGVLEKLERANGTVGLFPGTLFDFKLTNKLKCQRCNRVTYRDQKSNCIQVDLPVSVSEDSDEKVVDFASCLSLWGSPSAVELQCGFCNAKTSFISTPQFKTYPEVLVVVMQRFVAPNWVPQKLKSGVAVPETPIDLDRFRHAVDPTEELIPEGTASREPAFNAQQLNDLMTMGFSELQSKHALLHVNHSSVDAATEWLFANLENPEINKPLETAAPAADIPEDSIATLEAMGFSRKQVLKALRETSNNLDRAVDYLFSHGEDMDTDEVAAQSEVVEAATTAAYQLHGFVTHLGASVHTGHYVAHVKKQGEWIYYNDNKVASTDSPPSDKAYLYFFLRV